MALQQQREQTTEAPSRTESPLLAFWREVVVENPVYRKETLIALPIAASLPEEKQEELRNKARSKRAAWEALTQPQKLWKKTYPQLIVFGVASVLVPMLALWLKSGLGGIASGFWGLLFSGLAASSSIAAEREKRTWNALLLSGLTARQILGGKLLFHFQNNLNALVGVFMVALAVVLHGFLPAVALLLIFPVVTTHLLIVLLALHLSLWSTSIRLASRKSLWCVLTIIPLFLTILLPTLALAGKVPSLFLLLPLIYTIATLFISRVLWKRMERDLWRAPKDFSG